MRDRAIILFPFEKVDKDSRVVIYGSGDIAQAYYWELVKTGYATVVAWTDVTWNDGRELDYPRMCLDDVLGISYDCIVIGINDRIKCEDTKNMLESLGVSSDKILVADNVLHFTVENYHAGCERKLRVGFVSTGNMAHTMALAMHDQCWGVELYAVASRSLEKARDFGNKYGFAKTYGSYEQMLDDAYVDVVYIASPVNVHYDQIMQAFDHGKHVICEKPIAVNAKQVETLINTAKEKALFLTDGVWTAYLPMTQYIPLVMNHPAIGKVHMVSANLHYCSLYDSRLTEYNMRGGQILENGYYLMEFLSLLIDEAPVEITASGQLLNSGVDFQSNITLKYPGDLMAVMNIGLGAISDQVGFVYGEKGMAVIRDANQFKQIMIVNSMGEIVFEQRHEVGYWYEIEACVRAINAGMIETKERNHNLILSNARMLDEIRGKVGVVYPEDK